MTKTKCNKVKNNKTLKKTNKNKKQIFAQQISKKWKEQTNGCAKIDDKTTYKYDYYLLFSNFDDYDNHIHLILESKYYNRNLLRLHSTNNYIVYIMKKYDVNNSKIIHSKQRSISIHSDPAKIVYEIIEEYDKFINS